MNKLRFGILGTAKIARSVVPHLVASEMAEVVAVASRSLPKAEQFAAEFGIPHAFGDYETLLQNDSIDAVYIPLPPSMHCEWTIKAAVDGKHVLCEKPLGVQSDEVQQMIKACRDNEVVLLDGTMWYHTARAREMKRLVVDGELGGIRQITSAFTFPGDALSPDNVRFAAQLGGGSLLDIGWYCVGVSLWMSNAMPEQVFAAAQWLDPSSPRDSVDMHMNGLMWFPDNVMASFESGFTAIRRRWVEVTGSKAAIVCDDFTRPWNPEKPRFWVHDANGVSQPHVIEHPAIERCLVDAFCSLVREKRVAHEWSLLSLQTQHVCDALLESARSGMPQPVPPLNMSQFL